MLNIIPQIPVYNDDADNSSREILGNVQEDEQRRALEPSV